MPIVGGRYDGSFIHSFTSCIFIEHLHARPCARHQEWLEKADTIPAILAKEAVISQVISQITTEPQYVGSEARRKLESPGERRALEGVDRGQTLPAYLLFEILSLFVITFYTIK